MWSMYTLESSKTAPISSRLCSHISSNVLGGAAESRPRQQRNLKLVHKVKNDLAGLVKHKLKILLEFLKTLNSLMHFLAYRTMLLMTSGSMGSMRLRSFNFALSWRLEVKQKVRCSSKCSDFVQLSGLDVSPLTGFHTPDTDRWNNKSLSVCCCGLPSDTAHLCS